MMTEAETHSPDEYKAPLRTDFASFPRHSFQELNARTPSAPSWHFEVSAAKLAPIRAGHTRRLIVNVPPRSTQGSRTALSTSGAFSSVASLEITTHEVLSAA
jgi:hypothetical protein